ncbi:LysM peptidoglycan-binding domain-containing protein [Microbacterium sp. SSW1-59]|uniref:LysM peptidoglycan-binding domain-containing protein n=1 Tax=Microbacterium xanthum TaxID=3079794 RepID=UPI003A0FF1E7
MPVNQTTDLSRPRGARIHAPAALLGSLAVLATTLPTEAAEAADTGIMGAKHGPAVEATNRAATTTTAAITTATPTRHVVRPGDTISGISSAYGLRTADVLALNGLGWASVIHPGQEIILTAAPDGAVAASGIGGTHTVAAGDTVFAIAQRHDTTVDAVLAANGLGRDAIIYPGQTLALPDRMALASASSATTAPATGSGSSEAVDALDAEQIANVQMIISIGRELGVSERGIAIALGTAMQESWLRNLDWGDRDSLGLFQQRPSTGWGTADQLLDRRYAILVFFGGDGDPNGYTTRGLLDIPGWEAMSYAEAAQAVQISAYPDRYARWEQPAYAWLAAHG